MLFRDFRAPLKIGITLLAGAALGISIGFAAVVFTDLPQVESLQEYRPKGVTRVRDRLGKPFQEFFIERRDRVPIEHIPPLVRKAFLAAEDWRFYDHIGLDLRGFGRAVLKNILERRYAEGASTITQQLAKVLFLRPEKTLRRKFMEALLAIQIERRHSKNEILGLYLNQIYLGAGAYGVEAASRTYFGRSISELSVAEVALLAGLPKGPEYYSPLRHPERARARRDMVLQLMFERQLISRVDLDSARGAPLPEKTENDGTGPSYLAAYLLNTLAEGIGGDQVYRGGFDVESTIDIELQQAAEDAVALGIEMYARRKKIPPENFSRLPQAALLAVDLSTGGIRALVGGRAFRESQFNRAVQASRQPGSAIKPILYASAIERGFTQASLIEDAPLTFDIPGNKTWKPKNYDNEYQGFLPLRGALELSKNTAAVRLLQSIGVTAFRETAKRLGIDSAVAPNLSSALGSSSLTLPEIARAYAVLGNNGVRPVLHIIRSVTGGGRGDLWPPPPPGESVLDQRLAFIMKDMLEGVVKSGTGMFASSLPCAVAGKTGTTDDYVDSMFVGFSSQIVAVAWMGFDDRKSLGPGETGAQAAGPIWKAFMERACQGGAEEFAPPPGIALVDVDRSSGKRAGKYCADIEAQAFLEGTVPTEECTEEAISQF